MSRTGNRFPDYDVLDKRNTPSWNDKTRQIVDERLAIRSQPRFFTPDEWVTLCAICARIIPQPESRRDPIPIPAMIDRKLHEDQKDGYRLAEMPPMQQAWRQGLAAIDAEARHHFGAAFADLAPARQDSLLTLVQKGEVSAPEWEGLPAKLFFGKRVLHDCASAYYGHPTAWSEIGFGGPASPRGYVRMGANERDPWEPVERKRAVRE